MKKTLTILLLSLSLIGCSKAESDGPSKKGTVVDLQPITTPGFEGCVFGDLYYSNYSSMKVIRCPTTTSANYRSGKSTIQSTTVEVQPDPAAILLEQKRQALSRISPQDRQLLGLDK